MGQSFFSTEHLERTNARIIFSNVTKTLKEKAKYPKIAWQMLPKHAYKSTHASRLDFGPAASPFLKGNVSLSLSSPYPLLYYHPPLALSLLFPHPSSPANFHFMLYQNKIFKIFIANTLPQQLAKKKKKITEQKDHPTFHLHRGTDYDCQTSHFQDVMLCNRTKDKREGYLSICILYTTHGLSAATVQVLS